MREQGKNELFYTYETMYTIHVTCISINAYMCVWEAIMGPCEPRAKSVNFYGGGRVKDLEERKG